MIEIDEHACKKIVIDFSLIEKSFEVILDALQSGNYILVERMAKQSKEVVKEVREQFHNFKPKEN